jgi:hypothetical protein
LSRGKRRRARVGAPGQDTSMAGIAIGSSPTSAEKNQLNWRRSVGASRNSGSHAGQTRTMIAPRSSMNVAAPSGPGVKSPRHAPQRKWSACVRGSRNQCADRNSDSQRSVRTSARDDCRSMASCDARIGAASMPMKKAQTLPLKRCGIQRQVSSSWNFWSPSGRRRCGQQESCRLRWRTLDPYGGDGPPGLSWWPQRPLR